MFQRLMVLASLCACSTTPVFTGSALPINMLPANAPAMHGSYDFDLLGPVRGKGCVPAPAPFGATTPTYWVSAVGLNKLAPDVLTTSAINAAAFDAINGLKYADTLVVTRIVAEREGNDLCAYVYGRGVRLTKEGHTDATDETKKPDEMKTEHHGETNLEQ